MVKAINRTSPHSLPSRPLIPVVARVPRASAADTAAATGLRKESGGAVRDAANENARRDSTFRCVPFG